MKHKSLLITLFALLTAVGGTFATVSLNNVPIIQVYYIDNQGMCVLGTIEDTVCLISDVENCLKLIFETGDIRQIYADILNENTCMDPYEAPCEK